MSTVTAVTDTTFDAEVLHAAGPVLVDFWAEWCGPCKQVAPVLDALAAEQDRLRVVKVNVDENPALAAAYGITSIPTLLVFDAGQPVKAVIGAKPKGALMGDLADFL